MPQQELGVQPLRRVGERGLGFLQTEAQRDEPVARRQVRVFASEWIVEEVRRSIKEIETSKRIPRDPWPGFNWFCHTARLVERAPMGKQRSRDPEDDPILGTALAGHVKTVVTRDNDLLELEKPFGIEMLHPRDFLRKLNR